MIIMHMRELRGKFIPKDLSELYEKLVKEDVKGELSKQEDWLIWKLSNGIILKIGILAPFGEGYIGVYYLKNGKEKNLTHWHPADDEIYRDLMEINHEDIIWIRKKSVFKEQPPVFIERKRYEAMSERRKGRYSILPIS